MLHLIVRSRNNSCKSLKDIIVPSRTILRLGSTTSTEFIAKHNNTKKSYVEINTAEACKISGNKILMKKRFNHGHIPTAEWCIGFDNIDKAKYLLNKWKVIIAKHKHSSKGNGIFLIENFEQYCNWLSGRYLEDDLPNNYIFEKYYTYSREYRIHVTKDGYFLADRKMLKEGAKDRWHRHANNSVWINENNPMFDKPSNWDEITKACVNAMKSINLDICCFDIKVQNNKHKFPKFIILESNSAPSLGEHSLEVYKQILIKMIYNEKL